MEGLDYLTAERRRHRGDMRRLGPLRQLADDLFGLGSWSSPTKPSKRKYHTVASLASLSTVSQQSVPAAKTRARVMLEQPASSVKLGQPL